MAAAPFGFNGGRDIGMIPAARRSAAGLRLVISVLVTMTACGAHSAAGGPDGSPVVTSPAAAASPSAVAPETSVAPTAAATTTAPEADDETPPATDSIAPSVATAPVGATEESSTLVPPPVKSGANVNAAAPVGDPISISIPSIGVESPLVPTGALSDGTMDVPADASTAGWFTGGPRPGDVGPAVIMGHVDQKKTGPGVFWHLRDMQLGAQAIVHTTTGDVTFVAVERELIPKDQFPTERVYGPSPAPVLRLITCGGSFDRSIGHYRSNVVVYLVQEASP